MSTLTPEYLSTYDRLKKLRLLHREYIVKKKQLDMIINDVCDSDVLVQPNKQDANKLLDSMDNVATTLNMIDTEYNQLTLVMFN